MSEWREYKLGDLGWFFGGVTSVKRTDYGYGTPFLPYKNVYKNSKVDISSLELMNVRPMDLERRSCIYGDIFFTASSETPDEVAMSSVLLNHVPNLTFNGFCKRYRLNDFNTLLPAFARYLFRGPIFRSDVYEVANGDIRFNISQESLAKIKIRIPLIASQTAIAQILYSLDDKIELNNEINKNLEALAQALFKHWFVDFELPDENGQPYKSSGGEMVESELGLIPKGWNIYSLDDILKTVSETYPLKNVTEVVFLNTGDIHEGRVLHNNVSDTVGLPGQAKKSLKKFDILFSEIRPANKRYAFVYFAPDKYVVSTKLMVLRPKIDINPIFPYFLLTQQRSLDLLQHLAESRSGTFPQITFRELSSIKFAAKSIEQINDFSKKCLKDRYEFSFHSESENKNLMFLRDTLLPKLISGELEVKEAIKQTEKVL
jgi:type I restriction enzyme, S subunit